MFEHYLFGEFIRRESPLCRVDPEEICLLGERASGKLQETSLDRIFELLDLTSSTWLDPDYPLRKKALDILPPLLKSSKLMVDEALTKLFTLMQRENLNRIVRGHLGRSSYLEDFEYQASIDGYLRAQPLGIVLHVYPEVDFSGCLDHLLYGFLTRNVSIMKVTPESAQALFLFARSLSELDEEGLLSKSFAVVTFSSEDRSVDPVFLEQCDGIFVHHCRESARSCAESLSPDKRYYFCGSRRSFSIITEDGFSESDADDVFERCARDVVLWEQRSCSSPHMIFVHRSISGEFMTHFPRYLDRMNRRYPQQNLTFDEKLKILNCREDAKLDEIDGSVILHHSPRSSAWTVIYEESPVFRESPGNRTVYVKLFSSWAEILGQVVKVRGEIHTVGILASSVNLKTLAKALTKLGVSRITRVGSMGDEKPGAPVNFDFPLRQLVRWVAIESADNRIDLGDRIATPVAAMSRWDQLRGLLRHARENSGFYHHHLFDIDIRSIDSSERYSLVPFLNRDDIREHVPPLGDNLLTAPLSKAHIFSSGEGGEDRFVIYSTRELDEVTGIQADIYHLAGLQKDARVLNLFSSGFLSMHFFVSYIALEKLSCVNLPVFGGDDPGNLLELMMKFKPDAVMGPLSVLSSLAVEARALRRRPVVGTILYGGGLADPETLELMGGVLGGDVIRSSGLTAGAAGLIGYQCPYLDSFSYHLTRDHVFLEIIDPSTMQLVSDGGAGELVVTNLGRYLMPVIRFRTGIFGRIRRGVCSCGSMNPVLRLEFGGRNSEV